MTRRLTALALVAALGLAGCSGDAAPTEQPTADPSALASETTAPASTSLELPDGVTLTDAGADLSLGDPATVAWEPRAGLVGVLEITVDALGQARTKDLAGWKLDKETRRATPYFVISTVRNAGDIDLGGFSVPLFLGADSEVLVQPSEFREATFQTCESKPFPEEFAPGEELTLCQVFLVPEGASLANITFRPTQDFDPIEWTGRTRAWQKVPKKIKRSVGSQLRAKEKAAKKAARKAARLKKQQKQAQEQSEQSGQGDTD